MTHPTPQDPTAADLPVDDGDVLHPERAGERPDDGGDEDPPLDPAGPTELGTAVDG